MFSRWDAPLAGVVFLVALWVNLSAVAMTEFHRDEARWVHRARFLEELGNPAVAMLIAAEVNDRAENIGARRLHTVMERLLESVSFDAAENGGSAVEIDAETGAILARNPWNLAFGERIAFADLGGRQTAWTADRREFLGRHGTLDSPAALAMSSTPIGSK